MSKEALASIFVSALMLPIIILNFVGGIGGGIWLAIVGEWHLLLLGIGAIFLGHWVISLAIAPGMIFAAPAIFALNKGKALLGAVLGIPSLLWTYVVLIVWCATTFIVCLNLAGVSHTVPTLLWAYTVATAPWTFLAQHEARSDPNSPAILTTSAAQVGCIVVMIEAFSNDGFLEHSAIYWGLGIPLALGLGIQVLIILLGASTRRRYEF